MIKENILGKCFRSCSSCADPRISPLTAQYGCPRPFLLIITSCSENQQNRTEVLFHYSMQHYSSFKACFEHSNFFKVNFPDRRDTQLRAPQRRRSCEDSASSTRLASDQTRRPKIQLRAFQPQQLKYTLLELELPRLLAPDLPSNGYSLKRLKCTHSNYRASYEACIVIFRHYLPEPGMGNLRACCLPWMW